MAETANEALKMERRGERQAADQLLKGSLAANAPYLRRNQVTEYFDMCNRMGPV